MSSRKPGFFCGTILLATLAGCGGGSSNNHNNVGGTQSSTVTPTFSPAAGTYTSTQSMSLSDSTAGATIYYTADGSTPTTSSTTYNGPITVSTSETIHAIATASGFTTSTVGSAAYTIVHRFPSQPPLRRGYVGVFEQ